MAHSVTSGGSAIVLVFVIIVQQACRILRRLHPGVLFPGVLHNFTIITEGSSVGIPLLIVRSGVAVPISATAIFIVGSYLILRVVCTIVALGFRCMC